MSYYMVVRDTLQIINMENKYIYFIYMFDNIRAIHFVWHETNSSKSLKYKPVSAMKYIFTNL